MFLKFSGHIVRLMTGDGNFYCLRRPQYIPTKMDELTKLERVTAEELILIQSYRRCDDRHRYNLRQFALASASRCIAAPPHNVIQLVAGAAKGK